MDLAQSFFPSFSTFYIQYSFPVAVKRGAVIEAADTENPALDGRLGLLNI